jgi:hypothetical protein
VSSPQQQPGQAGPSGGNATAAVPAAPGGKPDLYRSPVAPLVWWVWVLFAGANLIDLAVQGRDHFASMVAAILLLITGVVYVAAFKPRLIADDEGMTIRNPLRDFRVRWNCVEKVVLGDSLEIFCHWKDGGDQRKKLYGWAVHSPRRSRLKAEMRARRQAKQAEKHSTSFGNLPPEVKEAMTKTDAEHIVKALESRAVKARKVAIGANGPVAICDRVAIASRVVPVVLLIGVALT